MVRGGMISQELRNLKECRGLTPLKSDFDIRRQILWTDMVVKPQPGLFHKSVARYLHEEPDSLKVTTSMDVLASSEFLTDPTSPTGFVFHMSRCGSSLFANVLSVFERHHVVFEESMMNQLLPLCRQGLLDGKEVDYYRNLILAFGPRPHFQRSEYFIKFTSWNVAFLQFIKKAFPHTPWIFIYREPHEVLVSNLEKTPGFIRQKPYFGAFYTRDAFGQDEVNAMNEAQYTVELLSVFCREALAQEDDHCLFVDYKQIQKKNLPKLLGFFGINPNEAELAACEGQFLYHSKKGNGRKLFKPDLAEKKKKITPEMRALVARNLAGQYQVLTQSSRAFKEC